MSECPHCPDGHPPFLGGSHPWNVFVGPDGQPTHLVVARGEHCAQSDADALYELINRRDCERDSVDPGLLIGLSGENVTQLLANEPVVVDAGELGMPPMQLVLRPVPLLDEFRGPFEEMVAVADRAYWRAFSTQEIAQLEDGDAESIASMRAALEAVLAHLNVREVNRLDPDNVRGALIHHQVFQVAYRTDAEIEAAQEALIDTLVGPNRHGDLDELDGDESQ